MELQDIGCNDSFSKTSNDTLRLHSTVRSNKVPHLWAILPSVQVDDKWRIMLLVVKMMFELVPSLFTIWTLGSELAGACYNQVIQGVVCSDESCFDWSMIQCENNSECQLSCMVEIGDNDLLLCGSRSSETSWEWFNATCTLCYGGFCATEVRVEDSAVVYSQNVDIQISLAAISCGAEIILFVVTLYRFPFVHKKDVYAGMVILSVICQITFCILLAANSGEFDFTVQVMGAVIASKLTAITFGAAHLGYLFPLNRTKCSPVKRCLRYGIVDETECKELTS
jgi:hypothetical protein